MPRKEKSNFPYIIAGLIIFIVIIFLFSYISSKNQEAKWRENNKVSSVRIIDVGTINPLYQEDRDCSLCKTGVYIESDGTKTCAADACGWKDVGGAMAIGNGCHICMTSNSQEICTRGTLKLTFQIDSKATVSLNCQFYNNGEATDKSVFNPGLNVQNYVSRDYSKSPQKYKVCCTNPSTNEPQVCSEEYPFRNPC